MMSSSDIESQPTSSRSPLKLIAISRRAKIILSVAFLLGAVAAVGVCAAAVGFSVAGSNGGRSDEGANVGTRSLSESSNEGEIVRNRRLPSNAQPADFRPSSSCYSDELNDTLPAAHIKGRGFEWPNNGDIYEPQWDCDGSLAFVAGGMWFSQEENSLYVPKCGWYSVSSDIAFQNNGNNAEPYSYTLRIDRNCGNDHDDSYFRKGNTVNSPVSKKASLTSVQINDVVKICTGGRIYVYISSRTNACCPRGYSETTALTAHLISESDCEWPVPSHKVPREAYQQQS